MSVKIKLTEQAKPKEIKYSTLCKYTGPCGDYVVLFTAPSTGIVVMSNNPVWKVGDRGDRFTFPNNDDQWEQLPIGSTVSITQV